MLDILNAGCILRERYEVRDLIFCGEKDAFYLVEDLNPPHEELAIREFIPCSRDEEEGRKEFWNRVKDICEVTHPNLLENFDFFSEIPEGKSNKRHYIVTEYIKGRTLQEIFQMDLREEPVPMKMLLKHMLKVCAALKHLNSLTPPVPFGVLKPSHILLTPDRRIKLFNYGLGNLLRTGFCNRTPGFASPEQVNKGLIDEKSDVFSLGSTMHYLLTGKNPEKEPNKFPPVSDYNSDVNPEVEDFISRCLSQRPSQRPKLKECSTFLLNNYMGRNKKTPPPRPAPPPPPPPEIPANTGNERVIEFVPQIEATIEEPSVIEFVGADLFSLSDEKEEPAPPASSKVETRKPQSPRRRVSSSMDESEQYKKQFQKTIKKRGTRKFDASHFMAAREAMAKKGIESPLASIKAKESIQKSADLLARIASTKKLKKPPSMPGKKTMSPDVPIKPDGAFPGRETMSPDVPVKPTMPLPSRETMSPDIPVKPTMPLPEQSAEPSIGPSVRPTMPLPEKTPQEEAVLPEETPAPPAAGEKPQKGGMSLAEKLALKYKKQKEERDQLIASGEYEESSQAQKTDPGTQKINYGTQKISSMADWKERVKVLCQPKPEAPPVLEPLKEGTVIKNRYEIAELINKDCYGAVYMAFDRQEQDSEKAIRAIKEIQFKPPSGNHKLGEKVLSNFVRFGNKLKKLDHPHLIKVKDYFFSYSGDRSTIRLFLVMEFIEGYTLEDVIKTHQQKNSKIPAVTIFALITKVCDALDYLHTGSPSRAHTDLNPGNILLTYSGEIKLINYSLREIFLVDNELVYPFYGTLGYFAPEQTGYDFNNTKADVFALGAITYYLLTGINPEKRPYEFVPVKKINPYISQNVEEMIESCIKIDAQKRTTIKKVKDTISKIKLVELDASLLEKQKAMSDKRKASMAELGNVAPLSGVLLKIALIYVIPIILGIGLIGGAYFAYDYYMNKPTKGPKLFVVMNSEKLIREIDLKSNRFTGRTIKLNSKCDNIIASSSKKQAFVTDGTKLYTVDTEETNKCLTGTLEIGMPLSFMTLSPDGTKLYLLSNKKNKLKGVDIVTKTIMGEISVPDGPVGACVSYDEKEVYVINNLKENFLTIVDTDVFKIKKKIPVDKSPADITVTKDGTVFITHKSEDIISAINITTGKKEIISTQKDNSKKSQPTKLLLNGNELYVINQHLKEVIVINTQTKNITDRITFDGYPRDLKILDNKLYIYELEAVGVKRKYFIIVMDTTTKEIIEKIPLEGTIIDMAVGED